MWVFPQTKIVKTDSEESILVEWFRCKLFICQVTVQLQNIRQVKGMTTMLMLAKHSPHVI
jgi:hypothetical protein